MPLNVSGAADVAPTTTDRGGLATALLDELTTRAPHDWVHRLRKWPGGGISLVHLQVLIVLRTESPLSMRRLAESLDVSEASATGIVDRMERRGLVERHHATEDRRQVLVQPTARGRRVQETIEETRRAHLAKLLEELTEEELAGFLGGLRALRAAGARLRAGSPDVGEGADAS